MELLLSNGWTGAVVGFLAGLIPLIVIHEFGHLLMAKLLGVWAREFGIGFPPRIAKLFKWGETQFTLNWLPLGGFVRLEGENTFKDEADAEPSAPVDAEAYQHSLYAQTPGRRSLLFLGGPVMNLLTAWALTVMLFLTGIPGPPVYIQEVRPGSPAAVAGMQVGDALLSIGGQTVATLEDVQAETYNHLGLLTEIEVERGNVIQTLTLTPRDNPPEGEGAMGVLIGYNDLHRYPLFKALSQGTRQIFTTAVMLLSSFFIIPLYIIQGILPWSMARPVGPIGISQIAQRSLEASVSVGALYPFIEIVILISLSLGIFNLLPIPALDGGRIVFALVEKVRRKPVTPEIEERIHMVALALLMLLFLFVTALDIFAPVIIP